MNTTNTRKKISAALAVMAVAMLTVGTLAYFTDRATGTANFTVMQADDAIDIVLTPENPDPQPGDPDSGDNKYDPEQNPDTALNDWLNDLNATAKGNLNPGDRIRLIYGISNEGKLAVDARETIVVRSSQPLTDGAMELQLVNGNASKDTNNAYEVTGSMSPTSISGDKKTVTYVFNKAASNDYQGITVTVDYLVEAKQNTPGDTWTTVATDTITFGGNAAHAAVPAAE